MGFFDWFKKKPPIYHQLKFDGVYYYTYFLDGHNELRVVLYKFYDDKSVIRIDLCKVEWETDPGRILKWFTKENFIKKKRHLYTKYSYSNNNISFVFKWKETSYKMSDDIVESIKPIENRKSEHIKGEFLKVDNDSDFDLILTTSSGEKKLKFFEEWELYDMYMDHDWL